MKSLQVLALSVFVAATAQADDWPQWMGPKRDNIWREEGIIDSFPQGGPKAVWRTPIAGGYAGPAVAGGKVFVTDAPEVFSGEWLLAFCDKHSMSFSNTQYMTFNGNVRFL